jgi:hypothetical protein
VSNYRPAGQPLAETDEKQVRLFTNRENDMQEITGHLNRHVTAGVEDKEMEAAKIDSMAQNSLKGERLEVESAQIETESKGQTLWSRMVGHLESLSATLVALTALTLVSLFFSVVSVTAVFSGGKRSAMRRRRR